MGYEPSEWWWRSQTKEERAASKRMKEELYKPTPRFSAEERAALEACAKFTEVFAENAVDQALEDKLLANAVTLRKMLEE
jgi:hypothetical protein